jgi:hypothetical protein
MKQSKAKRNKKRNKKKNAKQMDAGGEAYRGSEVLRTSAWVAGRASDVSILEAGVRSAAISVRFSHRSPIRFNFNSI